MTSKLLLLIITLCLVQSTIAQKVVSKFANQKFSAGTDNKKVRFDYYEKSIKP